MQRDTLKNRFAEVIKGRMAYLEKSNQDVIEGMCMSTSTYYDRLNRPESWRLDELMRLVRVLEIDGEQFCRILGIWG